MICNVMNNNNKKINKSYVNKVINSSIVKEDHSH